MTELIERTWAQIDLNAVAYNIKAYKTRLKNGCMIMAVIKANAYGHGDIQIARCCIENGVEWLAVSNIGEAVRLRKANINAPLLILGYTPAANAHLLWEHSITQAAISYEYAKQLASVAHMQNKSIDVHIKIDSGMHRVGISADERDIESSSEQILEISRMSGINITGVFTHFCSSDEKRQDSVDYTLGQFDRFNRLISLCEQKGINLGIKHCSNSAAITSYPQMNLNMVRLGISLYGMPPSDEMNGDIELKRVMSLYSSVSMVKTIEKGEPVSYGRTFTATQKMRVATVSIGYADGYHRVLSNKARMLVNGKFARVLGRVCMDQLVIDVTDIENVKCGDIVCVFGRQGENEITCDELARLAGTINYEIVCAIAQRVPRAYVKDSQIIEVDDYLNYQ